jgi:hypothetical protein
MCRARRRTACALFAHVALVAVVLFLRRPRVFACRSHVLFAHVAARRPRAVHALSRAARCPRAILNRSLLMTRQLINYLFNRPLVK